MIKCKLIDKECRPIKAHTNDAGFDLKSRIDIVIRPMETVKIPVGFCIAIPEGYEGNIKPRSNVAMEGLHIEGTIDSGYTGEVHMIATNLNTNSFFIINEHDRIAQIIITKINPADVLVVVDELPQTARGNSGFGSTGR